VIVPETVHVGPEGIVSLGVFPPLVGLLPPPPLQAAKVKIRSIKRVYLSIISPQKSYHYFDLKLLKECDKNN
jgi:hypothetical protein